HLIEPDNNEIYYLNTNSIASTGFLDFDDTDGFGPENIFYNDTVPAGDYLIQVAHYSGVTPTNYVVTVKNGGSIQSYSGTLSFSKEIDDIITITRN
ncbi:hypothetical protein JHD50_02845, partial [Sulfurimonas sp. MAG313]